MICKRILYSCCFLVCVAGLAFQNEKPTAPFIVILGIAQDAGYPQAGCSKNCCKKTRSKKEWHQKVSSLALIDPASGQKWIFDATPDFTAQLQVMSNHLAGGLSGIFLTHAHTGHYTGLMYLGREAMNTKNIPVYTMPRMHDFLANNGPWSQLVSLKNIELKKMKADSVIRLTDKISVTPLLVPHRDEFSETAGYVIHTENKSLLFIPDIDKWQKWNQDIRKLAMEYDYLLLDGTFYNGNELPGRNMNEIPHPFVLESMDLFRELSPADKAGIWFIHFNHTNPLLNNSSAEYKEVIRKGFGIARERVIISL